MRFQLSSIALAACLSLFATGAKNADSQADTPAFTIDIKPIAGYVYPSFQKVTAIISVQFGGNPFAMDQSGYTLEHDLESSISKGWNCFSTKNYKVTFTEPGSKTDHQVELDHVTGPPCDKDRGIQLVQLYLADRANITSKYSYKVDVLNVTNKSDQSVTISSISASTDASAKFGPKEIPTVVSMTPQSVPNEPLSDGTYKGVEQLALSAVVPLENLRAPVEGAVWYLNSTDIISSNERDKKSAFSGGFGYEAAFGRWYAPFKLEEDIQGNQIATNLSSVTSANLSTEFKWDGTSALLQNWLFQIPLSPTLTISLPYTHRINQYVTGKAKPLPVNDFAVNPSLAMAHATLLKGVCDKYQRWANPGAKPNSAQLCLGLEADWGLWYLPLEDTSRGSQRAEGYGDVSFLIPVTDFQRPLSFVDFGKDALQSQFRIEYSDSVSAANNYARTKKWSFGVELIK
jgi:hypothetical protein